MLDYTCLNGIRFVLETLIRSADVNGGEELAAVYFLNSKVFGKKHTKFHEKKIVKFLSFNMNFGFSKFAKLHHKKM